MVIRKSKLHWKSHYFKIIIKFILKYGLYSSNFDALCLLIALAIIAISNETRNMYLINIATIDRKDRKPQVIILLQFKYKLNTLTNLF